MCCSLQQLQPLTFRSGMTNLVLEERWAVLSAISSQLLLGSGLPGTLISHSSAVAMLCGHSAERSKWACPSRGGVNRGKC